MLGLQPAITALNQAYNQLSNTDISRADFYAKCGQVAAERGRQNAGKLSSHTTQCKRYPMMHCISLECSSVMRTGKLNQARLWVGLVVILIACAA